MLPSYLGPLGKLVLGARTVHFTFELEDLISQGQLFPGMLGLRKGEFGVK